MANPLFNQYGGQSIQRNNFINQLQQFQSMINGDPQQIVQNLIQSGQMSQDQFNQYSQMANQIMGRR